MDFSTISKRFMTPERLRTIGEKRRLRKERWGISKIKSGRRIAKKGKPENLKAN